MKDITIIIPVSSLNEDEHKLLMNSIDSARRTGSDKSPIVIVGPKETVSDLSSLEGVTVLINDGKTDFCSQINFAVSKCKTKYFSILEFDDEFTDIWFKNVKEYMAAMPEISMFIPLTEQYDFERLNDGPIGYLNEALWASSFSNEIGEMDLDCLTDYLSFNTTGSVIKTKDFVEAGGLKPSMKISFWYEFLLRFLNNSMRIYVIPKVGYHHVLNRKHSLTEMYHETVSQEEAEWWINLAQQEYFFKKDREKTYEE